jgi:AAHS family 4-hydroxybenzoate transporter-like MFS transporter
MPTNDARLVGARTARLDRAAIFTIASCSLAYLLDGLVHSVLGPLAPTIARELALTNAQLGPIFSANLIGQCLGLIVFPLLSARTGHRTIVLTTLAGFGTFQTLSGFVETGQQLFWMRLVTGFFLGGALPSCLAIVTAIAPPARRGLIISALFVAYGLGATLAGLVSLLFVLGGWRTATQLIGLACLASAIFAWFCLREPPARNDATHSKSSTMQLSVQLLKPPYLFGTTLLWLLFISMLTISYCLNSWLPVLLVQVGRDPSVASFSIAVFGIGGVVAGAIVGASMDRFGAIRVLVFCFVVSTVLLVWIGQVLASGSTTLLLILLGACGFFALGAYAGINVILATFYPGHLRALGIGLTKSVGRVGTVVAPIAIGFALSAGMRETMVISLFAVPTTISALALLAIATTRKNVMRES